VGSRRRGLRLGSVAVLQRLEDGELVQLERVARLWVCVGRRLWDSRVWSWADVGSGEGGG